jgi:hypothetical protein
VVRLAIQQSPNALVLAVGEPERPVERLFGDGRQVNDTSRAARRRPLAFPAICGEAVLAG